MLKTKRLISLSCFIMFLFLLLSACSGGNEGDSKADGLMEGKLDLQSSPDSNEGTDVAELQDYGDTGGLQLPLVDKPTTITWMLPGESELNGSLIAEEIEKRTGVKVDFQVFSKQIYNERLRVVLTSGKLPDIFHGLTPTEVNDIGQNGGVVAINDYLDMLPNYKKYFVDDNPWVIGSYGDEHGKIYTWPIYDFNRDVNHGFLYRKDIFDLHGIKEWTNDEEFVDALRQLKELYPDTYPYASKTKMGIFSDWSYGWGIGGSSYPASYNEANAEWVFSPTTPEHKEMLDFMKNLFNEGLLDPEFIADTEDSWTVKMTNNDDAFVTFDWIGRLDLFYHQVKSVNPDYDLRYANPVGPTGNIRSLPRVDNFGHAVANNENAEIALKLLDYLTSPSGGSLITLGIEGVNFEFDEDGKPFYSELADVANIDINVLGDKFGMWYEGMYLHPDRRSVYYDYTEKEQEAQDKIMNENRFEPLDPLVNLTEAETAEIASLKSELQKAADEFNVKYIFNENYGDTEWETWLNNASTHGAERYIEIMNEAQARLDASIQN